MQKVVTVLAILALITLIPAGEPGGLSEDFADEATSEGNPAPTVGSRSSPPGSVTGFTILPVGADLADIVVDSARNRAYVADRSNGRVLVVQVDTQALGPSVAVRAEPVALAMDPAGRTLYVGHAANRSIAVVDLDTLAVTRTIDTAFLTWDLVAPTDDTLVATTHDDQWSGQYPYVLNATDGTVTQRLWGGPDSSYLVYQDNWVALNRSRTRLFLADSQLSQAFLRAYSRAPNGTWVHEGTTSVGGFTSDIVVSPDDAWVYIAHASGMTGEGVARLSASTLTYGGGLGGERASRTVDVSPSGTRVASSSFSPLIEVVDLGTGQILSIWTNESVERLRITADARYFVASAGDGVQDIKIIAAVRIFSYGPSGATGNQVPEFAAEATPLLVPMSEADATIEVDGATIPSSYDRASGIVRGTPPSPLAEGSRTVSVRVFHLGVFLAEESWNLFVDLTPPALNLDSLPSTLDEPAVTVSGQASDPNLATVNVSGQTVSVDSSGRFSQIVTLQVGDNTIEIVARDAAGNEARVEQTVAFVPPVTWFVHPAKHFRIQVPYGWSSYPNTTLGGEPVDVLLQGPSGASLFVASESRSGVASTAARPILEQTLRDFSSLPGFEVLEPPSDRSIDAHGAARAAIRSGAGAPVRQVIVVVVGPEWGLIWALVGTTLESEVGTLLPAIEASIASFDVLPAPPNAGLTTGLLLAGVAAGVVAAIVAAWFVIRRRRPPKAEPAIERPSGSTLEQSTTIASSGPLRP